MKCLISYVILVLFAFAQTASAAEEEGGLWATAGVRKAINERVAAAMAVQLRFTEDIETLERTLLRPTISYRLDPRQVLTLGYDAHFIDAPSNRVEQRLWQQHQVTEKFSSITGALRFRLEERFIDHVDGVPVRLRVRAGVKVPLGASPWFFNLASEAFFGFNEVVRAQRDGFHENRAYAGFGRALGNGVVGQVGYQNQFLDRRDRDRMIHQMFISIAVRIP